MASTPKILDTPSRLDAGTVSGALWGSAVDAFVKTILVLVMGNIALGILGGIFSEMTPSAPPFLSSDSHPAASSNSVSMMHTWWSAAHEHQFGIVYLILFALTAWTRIVAVSPVVVGGGSTETRFQRIGGELSKNWFRLIVGNAFGALVSAIVIYFVETFTGTRLLVNLLLAAILPAINAIATIIFGSALVNFIGGMFAWYGDNQIRFNFWVLYVAAVCDDLGIPNLKTLARFLWLQWCKRNSVRAE